jgi:hypothetical protein
MQIEFVVRQVLESAMSATIFRSVPPLFQNIVPHAYEGLSGKDCKRLAEAPNLGREFAIL